MKEACDVLCALALLASALLASALGAQTTWVVSGGGQALQNAIALAAPGDVLDVQAGNYAAVTCSKGLRIALRPGALIDDGICAVTLTNVPSGQRFQLDGGGARGIAATGCAGSIVVDSVAVQLPQTWLFQSCTGPIVFDQADYSGMFGRSVGMLQIQGCPDVTFRNCRLPRMAYVGSRAVLQDCWVLPFGNDGPGVILASGQVALASGRFEGAGAPLTQVAHPAAEILGGELVVTGGALLAALQFPGQPAPAIQATGGLVRIDPSAFLAGAPPIAGPGVVSPTSIANVATTLTATTMTTTASGRPGDLLLTLAGLGTPPYATPWGDAWLLPTDPILDITLLPASGTTTFGVSLPAVPPFVLVTLQSVALDPSGGLQLGVPTRFCWN